MPSKQSTDRINNLNIALMLFSALLAFYWPFYLFLIAYAVLGPLHYLTEISWLHDKGYYTARKSDAFFLIAIGVVYGSSLLFDYNKLPQVLPNIIVLACIGSILLVITSNWYVRIALAAVGIAFIIAVPASYEIAIFSLMLLTIIHVYIFTGFFVAFGAMKSKSVSGYISLAVFVAMGALLFLYRPMPTSGIADAFVVRHYDKAFGDMNLWLLRVLNLSIAGSNASDPFEFSPGAVAVMRFIAFAYLYHYLNWFSKTKIIRWHEVSKSRLGGVIGLWVAAIIFYSIDYDLGLKALFFLSALHVLLELPLDMRTIYGVAAHIGNRVKSGRARLQPAP
jgi:hypothetical protein